MSLTLYHNPRGSEGLQTLALRRQHGFEPDTIEHLRQAPGSQELASIIGLPGIEPCDLLKTHGAAS